MCLCEARLRSRRARWRRHSWQCYITALVHRGGCSDACCRASSGTSRELMALPIGGVGSVTLSHLQQIEYGNIATFRLGNSRPCVATARSDEMQADRVEPVVVIKGRDGGEPPLRRMLGDISVHLVSSLGLVELASEIVELGAEFHIELAGSAGPDASPYVLLF